MQINGGCSSIGEVLRAPVTVLASGPAAAPAAALHHARRLGVRDLITIDMGGTSFDVCLIQDGRPVVSRTIRVEDQPIGVPGVEVSSIGAGGGSIAWVDAGGALRVGPRSAGARPGPRLLRRRRSRADRHRRERRARGARRRRLPRRPPRRCAPTSRARAIDEHVAGPLGLDTVAAAAGIVRVVESNMVSAIRAVSVERGIDPRRFTIVAGGGGGALHAARIARALGIARVIVPREAGTFCAFGMTVTDVRHDHARAWYAQTDGLDVATVRAAVRGARRRGPRAAGGSGFRGDQVTVERFVDARYPARCTSSRSRCPIRPADGFAEAVARTFHAEHQRRFTYERPELAVELLHWRLAASGVHAEARPLSRRRGTATGGAGAARARSGSTAAS